jgi:acetyl-CoA decarbonylase/synthase complex subunit delta
VVMNEEPPPVGFEPPSDSYPGAIAQVKIGATKSEGGTRKKRFIIGGARAPPFYEFEHPTVNSPVVASVIFDSPISLPRSVRNLFGDVVGDPVDWAKKWVKEFGSELVMVNLTSTDPEKEGRSPAEAAKTVEDILEAVDVPLIIGGSRNKDKDPFVLEKVAEVSEGECCVLSAASLEMDYKRVAKAAQAYGHSVISYSDLDFVMQKTINRYLLDTGLSKERLIMDPTTAALGYGLEYSLSIMERLRLAGLKGDADLQAPIAAMVFNAWAAPGAWEEKPDEPLWETITGVTSLLAGADLLIVLHPRTAEQLNSLIQKLTSKEV